MRSAALRTMLSPMPVPSPMGLERATNPFLRADVASVAAGVGMDGADAVSVFAEVRRRKDSF